jgi:hypothetical protein
MYEITVNMSWFPAWMLWSIAGAMYFSIGIVLSCVFKARETVQDYYRRKGCGQVCCSGNVCGKPHPNDYRGEVHFCNGANLTTNHQSSWEACQIGKCASIPLWPAVLAIGSFIKFCGLIKDLWHHAGLYGLKLEEKRLLRKKEELLKKAGSPA